MKVTLEPRANGTSDVPKRRDSIKPGKHRALTLDLVLAIEKRTGKTLRESVMQALRETGSEKGAAARLGTTVLTLRKWMAKMGIKANFRVEFVQE